MPIPFLARLRASSALRLRRLIVVWVVGSIAAPTYAFNSDEHRRMSDLAMAVAWGIAEADAVSEARRQEINDAMGALNDHYGQVTECVDFFLMPEKMLDLPWSNRTPEHASPDGMPLLGRFSMAQLVERCGADNSWSAHFMQATHNNHAHFQHDLLMALRAWHMLAVSVGQPTSGHLGNLYGALIINAIADHYLQDFFAPGHIVTPRDAMTDVQATAMHDLANKMGAAFLPRLQDPSLLNILKYLCTPVGTSDTCAPLPRVTEKLLRDANLIGRARPLRAMLSPGSDVSMKFKGDGQLFSESQTAQRIYMLAVQVRAILDIIDGQNHLQRVAFNFDRSTGRPEAKTDFGLYDFAKEGSVVETFIASEPQREYGGIQWPKLPICSFGQCGNRLYPLRSSSPVLSISDQRESQSNGAYPGRSFYLAELSWAGTLVDLTKISGRFLSAVQITPSLGYGWYEQHSEHGRGPTLRLSIAVPETEFSFGPYVRRLSYTDKGQTVRRNGFGFQIESGFSSYFTFFLLWGMDQSTGVNGDLQRGRMWGGGLRLSAPLTRLSLFD